MRPEVIAQALRRAGATIEGEGEGRPSGGITKADLFAAGLSGRPDSAQKRRALLQALDLPERMSANAMLRALELLYTREEFHAKYVGS